MPAYIIGIGTDIIECLRIAQMIERHGELFISRVYTDHEIEYCSARKAATQHYAGRWAAKEAVSKVLGLGVRGIGWRDIEVERRHLVETGQPETLEELEPGAVQEGPARCGRPTELDDEAAVQERPDGVVGVDAADAL